MAFSLSDINVHNPELLRLLTEDLPDMLWVKDIEGRYLYANQAICDGLLMAKDTQEPIGKGDVFFALRERDKYKDDPEWHTFGELCFNSDKVVIENNKPMRFEEYGNVKGELLYLEVYKAPFYDNYGNIIGTVGTGRDITELKKIQMDLEKSLLELNEQKSKLTYRQYHDTLTDLPNRMLLLDRLEQSIKRANTYNKKAAVLYIDIDHFKNVNDLLGHDGADQLLVDFAKRVEPYVSDLNTLARLNADEFCIVLNDVNSIDEVTNFVLKLMKHLKEPFCIDSQSIYISISVGISIFPDDGNNAEHLLRDADLAMKKAKSEGRNTYYFYDEDMTEKAFERVFLETALRDAFVKDELVVYYQPQINSVNDKIVGIEALVRWEHPTLGLMYPDKFIPLAEETGLIVELDRMVMKKAASDFSKWHDMGLHKGKLSLNLAIKQITEDDFIEFVESLIKEHECLAQHLEFEVTESQIMNDPHKSIETLQKLTDMNLHIAIDDFGTGYSSLAYLKRLPINKLKIDKSFVQELPHDAEDSAISKTIISLCQTLNLKVIAEGVETEDQKRFLLDNGCTFIQGYLYSHPISADEMMGLLESKSG